MTFASVPIVGYGRRAAAVATGALQQTSARWFDHHLMKSILAFERREYAREFDHSLSEAGEGVAVTTDGVAAHTLTFVSKRCGQGEGFLTPMVMDFLDDLGEPDLTLSSYELEDHRHRHVQAQVEHAAAIPLNPPPSGFGIDLSGHDSMKASPATKTAYKFAFTQGAHRELAFQNRRRSCTSSRD
jgi:hypothetical protein